MATNLSGSVKGYKKQEQQNQHPVFNATKATSILHEQKNFFFQRRKRVTLVIA